MPTTKIRAEYNLLESIAKRFGQWAESNQTMSMAVRQRAEPLLQGGWTGQAADSFVDQMGAEMLPALDRLSGAFTTSCHELRAIITLFQQAEAEAAALFKGSPVALLFEPNVCLPGDSASGVGVTVDQLMQIAPQLSRQRANELVPHINEAMRHFQIDSPYQQAMFLAQTAHESIGFTRFREIGAETKFDENYEGRLGNTRPDDGSRYKGRGAIQITGREMYRIHGQRIGLNLEDNPALAERDDVAFLVSASYWTAKKAPPADWFTSHRSKHDWSWIPSPTHGRELNNMARTGTDEAFDYISVGINPYMDYQNLPVRHRYYERAKVAFGLNPTGETG